MKLRSYRQIIILILFTVVTLAGYLWFLHSPYFESFSDWARSNFLLFFSTLVLIKIIGIVWPPISGGLLTLGSIPVIGWFPAYFADFLGSMIGSSIAYFIAKRWGLSFMSKIFDPETIHKVQQVKIRPGRELEMVFLARVFGGTIVEVICYGAGLLRVRFSRYFVASVLSHMAVGIPAYYFAGDIIAGRNILINLIFALILIGLFMFARHRYVELSP